MKLLALEKDVPRVLDNAFTDELLKQESARAKAQKNHDNKT
jgi:hypothetical protein